MVRAARTPEQVQADWRAKNARARTTDRAEAERTSWRPARKPDLAVAKAAMEKAIPADKRKAIAGVAVNTSSGWVRFSMRDGSDVIVDPHVERATTRLQIRDGSTLAGFAQHR